MSDMNNTGSIAGLITRIAAQDREAFGGLYRTVAAKLYGVALRILGNKAEAELVLQDVFTRIWMHAGRFDTEKMRGLDWVIGITRDCAIDRRRARHDPGEAGSDAEGLTGPEAEFMQQEEGRRVTACMAKLDPDCAQALRAAYLGGLSYEELASACNRPLAEVRPHLRDSLTQLMGCMEADDLPGMVPPADDGSEDGLEAAEYVIGSLSHDERRAAEKRLSDPSEAGFAAHVAAWRARFSPLNGAYVAVSPPDIQRTIESRIFGTPVAVQQTNLKRLAIALAGGVAAVVGVALITAVTIRDLTPPPELYAATLESPGNKLVFSAAWNPDTRKLEVMRTGGQAPSAGQAYQLWVIAKDGSASPLVVMQGAETVSLIEHIPAGAKLGVTLEESGGSAGGKPTGPMLVTGPVERL